ncbi:MAG: NADH-ubiquinone oxidoreductase chain L [Ktedonobacterales bacterium]|jgi:proton-translocating NADH-quinone oxidoreductase chain L|nr:MAG: NADH-ubiquinone oxidoreductase chain L [Ktedonobacterales bacterium]
MTPVDLVWLIPALPLAAMVLIFCVTRPLDVRSQHRVPPVGAAAGGHGAGDAAHETHDTAPTEQGASHGDAGHDDHGGGHGSTTPWGMVGSVIGLGALAGAFVWSLLILFQFLSDSALLAHGKTIHLYNWFTIGSLKYTIDFRVDSLTVVMLIVVTGVSMLVHLYSVGYMAGDAGYSRFYVELALFTLAMLILVLAANFLVLFIGWELVGLSSYLLVGFWFNHSPPPAGSEAPYPPPAQVKAFVTTRLGDFGFMIGILILFFLTGTFNFVELTIKTNPATGIDRTLVTIAMILVFCGAIGKSAQFPLHVWLPDAMAGPTPVSALIHAATMVAAGVYLVARLFPLYAVSAYPAAFQVVGYIGGFTALFAATIALTRYDIKGVLAYSTISQLGYMFVGLAVGETNTIGMYHLFTHAFFKALLFLGSGSVIHGLATAQDPHGVQDMRKMGGLAKFMPITALCFLVATLSISGIPPFDGFWSKDPIIATSLDRGNYVVFGMTLLTALLTAFYMFRLFFLTFGGKGGAFGGLWGGRAQYRGEAEHPHESSWVMWLPLVILATATVALGLVDFFGFDQGFAWFLNSGVNVEFPVVPALDVLTGVGVATALLGVGLAWLMYGLGVIPANAFTRNPIGGFVHRVLYNKYYLDDLYGWIIKYVALGLASGCALFDQYIIDGLVNGSARFVRGLGNVTRRSETGVLQNYGAALFGGALIIMIVIFFATGTIGK